MFNVDDFHLKCDGDYFSLNYDELPQYKEKYFYFAYPDGSNVLVEDEQESLFLVIHMKNKDDEYLLSDKVFLSLLNEVYILMCSAAQLEIPHPIDTLYH